MAVHKNLKEYFKPEVQNAAQDLIGEKAVILTVTSDTAINALIRSGTPAKVALTSTAISSPVIIATCNCSRAKKGVFCKHIWAVIETTDQKHPDFLDSKNQIEMREVTAEAVSPAKAKQAEFKKQQSERLKARNKELRLERKAQKKGLGAKPVSSKLSVSYPGDVLEALSYFKQNGFDLETPLVASQIQEARKLLSRIFHPDKGGSHEETLELHRHYDLLMEYTN